MRSKSISVLLDFEDTLMFFSAVLTKEQFSWLSVRRCCPKWVLPVKDRSCSYSSKFWPSTVDSHREGRENEKCRVFPPVCVHIYLKRSVLLSGHGEEAKISKTTMKMLVLQLWPIMLDMLQYPGPMFSIRKLDLPGHSLMCTLIRVFLFPPRACGFFTFGTNKQTTKFTSRMWRLIWFFTVRHLFARRYSISSSESLCLPAV